MADLFAEIMPWACRAAKCWCVKHGIPDRLHEDCVQESVIATWKAIARVRKGSTTDEAKTFIMGSIVGAIKDFCRREAPKGYRNRGKKNFAAVRIFDIDRQFMGENLFFYVADPRSSGPFDQVDNHDLFCNAMSKLQGRELVVWSLLSRGMNQKEAAKFVGVSECYMYKIVKSIKERVKRVIRRGGTTT